MIKTSPHDNITGGEKPQINLEDILMLDKICSEDNRIYNNAEVFIKRDAFQSGYLPEFEDTKKGIMAWLSTMLICRMLLIINIAFFLLALGQTVKLLA